MSVKKEALKRILLDIAIAYGISFLVVIITKGIMAFINGEEVLETLMLSIRSYLLGSITTDETIFAMKMESIGLFAIHFTAFFALLFYYPMLDLNLNKIETGVFSLVLIIVGAVLTIFIRERIIWCITMALLLSGIILLIAKVFENIKIKLPVNMIIRVLVVAISFVSIACVLAPYFIEDI